MKTRHLLIGSAIAAASAVAVVAGVAFYRTWALVPPVATVCVALDRVVLPAERQEFAACLAYSAERFSKVDFVEMKDLSKSFMTLILATFVASITFAERIVGAATAGPLSRILLVLTWAQLLFAVLSIGSSLVFMTMANFWAMYYPHMDYRALQHPAAATAVVSCLLFASGLLTMLFTGAVRFASAGAGHAAGGA